jgi:4-hydroxy-3-methylbut-2-en-1-yl diphosphate synthase IspG/GcpE
VRILAHHGIAIARTLEQKISDAGPFDQRIDPHILTPVRKELVNQGRIIHSTHANIPWFHVKETAANVIQKRLAAKVPIFQAFSHGSLSKRIGQTLEIATYLALLQSGTQFYDRFKNLDAHDDSKLYSKEEPPQHIGSLSLTGDQRLDFLTRHPEVGHLGIECKNIREWIYPDRTEVNELLLKR